MFSKMIASTSHIYIPSPFYVLWIDKLKGIIGNSMQVSILMSRKMEAEDIFFDSEEIAEEKTIALRSTNIMTRAHTECLQILRHGNSRYIENFIFERN